MDPAVFGQRALDGDGTVDGGARFIEGNEEAVASVIHFVAAILGEESLRSSACPSTSSRSIDRS
jgi:hypothetical protein